jgi:YD repeat-containing protein
VRWDYDALNRPVGERWFASLADAQGETNVMAALSYGYDELSRLLSAGDGAADYTFGYDAQDRLTSQSPVAGSRKEHEQERRTWLRMEFKTFVQAVIHVPCQIVRQARRTIYRVLSWNPYLTGFVRLCDELHL